jgi:hypothetical protein
MSRDFRKDVTKKCLSIVWITPDYLTGGIESRESAARMWERFELEEQIQIPPALDSAGRLLHNHIVI